MRKMEGSSTDRFLYNLARLQHPDETEYKAKCQMAILAFRLSSLEPKPSIDNYSVMNKMKKMNHIQRVKDFDLTKAMMVQDMVMQEQTKQHSKYVLKHTFDFGLKNYYCKVSDCVKNKLASRGIPLQQRKQLIKQKKQSALRRVKMLQIYHQMKHPKPLKTPRKTTNQTTILQPLNKMSNSKSNKRLNINFQKHHIIRSKKLKQKQQQQQYKQNKIINRILDPLKR